MLLIQILFLLYVFMIFLFFIGWFRNKDSNNSVNLKISVVIAVRNEQERIIGLVNNLKSQDYDISLYDVVIVNDNSEDNTLDLLLDESEKWTNLKVISLKNHEGGKKQAILKGVRYSTSDVIITTDADCSFTNNWISKMASCFLDEKINLVSGPVCFTNQSNFFCKIQTLEFLSLIGSAAGAIGIKKPILCNGANLAYRRNIFLDINDYESNDISSGDDVFLLHSIKKNFSNSIVFINNPDAIVTTEPVKNLNNFLQQRLRWSAKSTSYTDIDTILVSVLVFLVNISLTFMLIYSICEPSFLFTFIWFFTLKFLIDFVFLIPVLSFFKRTKLIKWILPLQFIYPIYITLISISSNFLSFNWKGRISKT